jgi:membrane protein DedA with SNARE-associated domain
MVGVRDILPPLWNVTGNPATPMEQLPHWVSSIPVLPAIFVGTFLFGETVVLAGIVLAAAGAVPVPALLGLSMLGTLASDLVWFVFGQRLVHLARRWRTLQTRYERAMEAMERVDDGKRFYYLLYYKFVYGIRIVTIIFTSLRRIPLRRFLLLDAIGTAAYMSILIGVGLLLCQGATELAPAVHTLRYLLAAPVLLFILMRMGTQWLRKRLFDA